MIPTAFLKRAARRVWVLPCSFCALFAQVPTPVTQCKVTTTPVLVAAEGLTERVGDLTLTCSASNPAAAISADFTLYLPFPVTNRVDAANLTRDAILSVDLGSGFVPTGSAGLVSGSSITFHTASYNVPASGMLGLRISNVRGAINRLGYNTAAPVQVLGSLSSTLPIDQSQFVLAYAQPGLLSNLSDTSISCYGSPAPQSLDMPALFAAGTALASTRVTEGFATSFAARAAGADTGTRFLVKYTGFPDTAHLYIPDAVAGSTALKPTSGGDLDRPPAVGQYQPGSNSLLLVRVNGSDSTGAGGSNVAAPSSSGPLTLASVSEVGLTNGSGFAVYEVVDANPNVQETAQFPTFISLPRFTPPAVAQESIALAPVSAIASASVTAPVPRFAAVEMLSDCALLGGCRAPVVLQPKLFLEATPIKLTAVAAGALTSAAGKFLVHNEGGGTMDWKTNIIYEQGTNWLALSAAAGSNEGSVQVSPQLAGLSAGTYHATIIVDAATAGRQSVPVTLTVAPAPAPPPPAAPSVVVSDVWNAATLEAAPLVAGSLTTLKGSHLAGAAVAVTFDGAPATLLYASDTQINLLVPALGARTSASVVVTVDGVSSKPVAVPVGAAWPAVFAHGVLNQDSGENLPQAPAKFGDILQIFATGIPAAASVSVRLGDRGNLVPVYAGEAPNFHGLQQVNVAVPDGSSGLLPLKLCATVSAQEVCSPAAWITVR
ncbi:MAG: IPT/TIG domain-containing protein [Candidatus Solibacter sp.]